MGNLSEALKFRMVHARLTVESYAWSLRHRSDDPKLRRKIETFRELQHPAIAVFHQGGIGNGLLLGPMLQILRSWKPDATVDLLSWQRYESQLLKAAGLIHGSWVLARSGSTKPPKDYDLLLSAARTYDGDKAVANIRTNLKVGFQHRVGWHKKSFLHHDAALPLSGHEHEVRANASLLSLIIEKLPPIPSRLIPVNCDLFLDPPVRRDTPVQIVLHPGSEKITSWKRYSYEKMAEAARCLKDERGVRIVVIAGPDELPEAAEVAEKIGRDTQIFRTTENLLDSFQLLRGSDCLITNDNAMMHLAAAAKCPTVAVFGPTDPEMSGPWGDPKIFRIVRNPLKCSPCYVFYSGRLDCVNKNYLECLNGISAAQVVEAAKDLLAAKKGIS